MSSGVRSVIRFSQFLLESHFRVAREVSFSLRWICHAAALPPVFRETVGNEPLRRAALWKERSQNEQRTPVSMHAGKQPWQPTRVWQAMTGRHGSSAGFAESHVLSSF